MKMQMQIPRRREDFAENDQNEWNEKLLISHLNSENFMITELTWKKLWNTRLKFKNILFLIFQEF